MGSTAIIWAVTWVPERWPPAVVEPVTSGGAKENREYLALRQKERCGHGPGQACPVHTGWSSAAARFRVCLRLLVPTRSSASGTVSQRTGASALSGRAASGSEVDMK